MFATGVAMWILLGAAAGLAASRIRKESGRTGRSIAWGVLGALLVAPVAFLTYHGRVAFPWYPRPMLGALAGGLAAGLLTRVTLGATRPWARAAARVVLASGIVALAALDWFVVARVYVRGFTPAVTSDISVSLDSADCTTAALSAAMARLARGYLSRPENAGIVIGASVGGRRFVTPAGVASRQGGSPPVTRQSRFEIGSVSKVLTGTVLALAVVAGEVRLEDSVGALVRRDARWRGVDPVVHRMPITLLDLAVHASGLPNAPPLQPVSGWTHDDPFAAITRTEVEAALAAAARDMPRTRSYDYSNFGYIVLADLLEGATGQPFERLLRERLLVPLGMTRTGIVVKSSPPPELVDGHAMGRVMPHWLGGDFAGAEGVVATADDLLTLAEAQMAPPPGPLGEALRLAMAAHAPEAEPGMEMGLGWHIAHAGPDSRIIFHSGSTLGFRAFLSVMVDERIAVVVLANSSDGTAGWIGSRLREALARSRCYGAPTPTGFPSTPLHSYQPPS